MSLGQLSHAASLNKTTTHRLLRALQSEALVERNPSTNGYRLGPALMAMGVQALASSDLRRRVRPVLKTLAADTGETATLEVPVEGSMLILDEITSSQLIAASGHVGTRWPLHATSTGKAYMAFAEEGLDCLSDIRQALTPKTVTNAEEFQRQIMEIRRRGYATASDELEEGYTAVATVVRGVMGDVQGAISLGGPTHRMSRARLADLGNHLCQIVMRMRPAA